MEPHWSQKYELALRELLPLDFPRSVPVYVVSRWEIDGSYCLDGPPRIACTSPLMDVWLKQHLEAVGRWRGRGFASVFFEHQFRHLPHGYPIAWAYLDVLLHEAAHWFSKQIVPDAGLQSIAALLADPEQVGGGEAKSDYLAWHGAAFVRSALHILRRVRSRGYPTDAERLQVGGYGLAPIAEYEKALRGEPEAREGEPLEIVLAANPPGSFVSLAEADLESLRRNHDA